MSNECWQYYTGVTPYPAECSQFTARKHMAGDPIVEICAVNPATYTVPHGCLVCPRGSECEHLAELRAEGHPHLYLSELDARIQRYANCAGGQL